MKLTGADRRMLAASVAAGAAMVLCFALGRWSGRAVEPLPWEPPAAVQAQAEGLVDINTAGLEELMSLPGIGEVRAGAILDHRAEHGPFRYPEDLIRVDGIGEGILSGLLDRITTGGEGDAKNFSGG